MSEWISIGQALQYRKHSTRKHGVRFDRYFRGRFTVDGKTKTFGFGWESEWNEQNKTRSFFDKCQSDVLKFKRNARKGKGPTTPKEEREQEEAKRQKAEALETQKEKEAISFSEYFQETYYPIAKTSKKPRSYEAEYSHFKNWLEPVLGNIPFRDIRPFHLERLKSNMLKAGPIERGRKKKVGRVSRAKKQKGKKGRSPRTIQYVFATFRQVWNHAHRDGFINRVSPSKQVKLPRIANKRTRFLTYEEADLLLEDLSERSQQLHDISLLSLHTGMRAGEIFSLTWNDVHTDQGTIDILDAKGGDRPAFMTNEVREMFERLFTYLHKALEKGAGPVFFSVGIEFVAPPLCSPSAFDALISPFDTPLFDLIHQYGGKVIVHHHGNIKSIINKIVALGADGIQPIEEPPVGDCTLSHARSQIGKHVCIIGSVQYDDFARLPPEAMEDLVKRQISDAGQQGSMILAPTAGPYAAILSHRQQENILKFIEAGLRWGSYAG